MAGMHIFSGTRRRLVATTAMTSTAVVPMVLIGMGVIMGRASTASAQESTPIPLEYIYKDNGAGGQYGLVTV